MITDEQFDHAVRLGANRLEGPLATAAAYDAVIGRVVISVSTGVELSFPPSLAQGLEQALPSDLEVIEVSPSGLGIHFPKLDADI